MLQLLSADYPAKIAVSANDAILHTAVYYIHFLAQHNDIAASDDDCKRFISLHKLLSFPRLQESCEGDISTLRYSAVNCCCTDKSGPSPMFDTRYEFTGDPGLQIVNLQVPSDKRNRKLPLFLEARTYLPAAERYSRLTSIKYDSDVCCV